MTVFKAFLIEEEGGQTRSRFVAMDTSELDPGEVTVRVLHSSINYKDARAATGRGRVVRRHPCIGGVDLAGLVIDSRDERFHPGDPVIATSYNLGVAHHGGYSEVARVPADWVVPLPSGLTLHEAMAIGTAGFTAALAIIRMEENGLRPDQGPVLVTGATGGVGSLAIDMLSGRGYTVTALTRQDAEAEYLLKLGANTILPLSALDLKSLKPLDKALWAGAVDSLGGDVLAWIASTMKPFGTMASIGLAAGSTLNTTVMPFILRGVCLLGIDSVCVGEPYRQGVWHRLASDLRPRHLPEITHRVSFNELPQVLESFLNGSTRGRFVVDVAGTDAPVRD